MRPTPDLNLAPIGNCSIAALIDRQARIIWSCFPRLDGDPVFCQLLNSADGPVAETGPADEEWGFWSIDLVDLADSSQSYHRNTAILETILTDTKGQSVRVTDFCPRFPHYGRMHKPTSILRIVENISGAPQVIVRLRPRFENGSVAPEITRGSNHVRYVGPDQVLRLTTDLAPAYLVTEKPFVLEKTLNFVLSADESLTAPIAETTSRFLRETTDYWQDYTRRLAIPYEYQEAVIRAAITLKLCQYEETGAIVAALTTSIPEHAGSERNWDYRYCWLRDGYFVVHALNRLGTTKTMEEYLSYIGNIVAASDDGYLKPLFSISLDDNLEEEISEHLGGFRQMGPVRFGNAAHTQIQNDSYGAVILASTQMFFDNRLAHPGSVPLYERLEFIGEQAVKRWDEPDAGPWELRTRAQVHTFSSVMCWAACDRLAKIGKRLGEQDPEIHARSRRWREEADRIHAGICENAFDPEINSFTQAWGGKDIDASMLLLAELGFVTADDPRFVGTVERVEKELRNGNHLHRYKAPDDFGEPETAFTICTFWYIEALAAIGRREEARELFQVLLDSRNHVGLLSEDIDPETGALWGNYPQTYSLVGLISAAMKLSKSWEEAF